MNTPQTKNSQYIAPDIKKEFPQDPMMQKLHQIRRKLTRNRTLKHTLEFVERTAQKTAKPV